MSSKPDRTAEWPTIHSIQTYPLHVISAWSKTLHDLSAPAFISSDSLCARRTLRSWRQRRLVEGEAEKHHNSHQTRHPKHLSSSSPTTQKRITSLPKLYIHSLKKTNFARGKPSLIWMDTRTQTWNTLRLTCPDLRQTSERDTPPKTVRAKA